MLHRNIFQHVRAMSTSTKPVILYAARTPNGFKPAVHLEELKVAYPGFDYDVRKINIGAANEQKQPWFLAINPNGRIPALTDRTRGADGFNVFESAAILLYLSQHFDKEYKLSFDPQADPEAYSEVLQWIFFAHGGIGPMQGQLGHFTFREEKIEYAIKRYMDETKRLYGVLELRLSSEGGREYLAGPGKGKFTIADINAYPWVSMAPRVGISSFEDWPHVQAWIERIKARPGVVAGYNFLSEQ